jgi:murein DD-endopeptidase MepM/ murein hydrolase activator NlpD
MFSFDEPSRSRAVSRIALLAVISAGLAGCSSDFSRFEGGPYASRPQTQNEVTGSVRQQSAPTGRVESSALPPPAPSQPTAGGGAGMASYNPPPAPVAAPAAPRHEYTGSIPPAAPRQSPAPAWSWDGGTAVVVAQGETIETISRRHGVPAAAILQANNMSVARQIQPGQRLVIPRVQNQLAGAPQVSAPQVSAPQVSAPQTRVAGNYTPAPAAALAAPQAGTHVIVPGETIYSLARHYKLTPMAIAKANNVGLDHHVKIGDRIVIPGARGVAAAPAAPVARPAQQAVQPAAQPGLRAAAPKPENVAAKPLPAPVAPQRMAQAEPAVSANIVTPAAEPVTDEKPTGTANSTSFRWPVRGRIIQGFGPKASGGQNDGINVSVPEGTPIKAAEEGVVAYAGSELKGYGNLVLVRHANGFVTAYAHASELSVKKGETVKRGQVIGKAGSTGNVTGPQLHFEVRKGATPVDPAQYLGG